ncbi:hypothetical protein GmHk_03G007163 [Glycine max]|nr:hypothetical protein GmHk_03G007163 [Glycine max]
MVDASTGKTEPTLDTSSNDEDSQPNKTVNSDGEELIFESREDLIKGHNQLLFTSPHVSKSYSKLNKRFQHLEREHKDHKKVDFVLETTSPGGVQDTSICEEVKALLNEKVSNGQKILLKDFQDLEERVKSLTTTLDDSKEERKELPPKIEKLYKEIDTFRDNLGKFICGHEALKKIIKVQRNPKDKSSLGFKGKKVMHAEEVNVFYFYGKVGHEAHKCKDLSEEGNPSKGLSSAYQHTQANKKKGPKKI